MTTSTKYILRDNDLISSTGNKEYVLRVKDLRDEEKPREKLLRHGPQLLTTNELLAIVLNVGTKKEEIMSMTSRILKEYGENNIVYQTNPNVLVEELGLPLAKACQIVACFALGRRFFAEPKKGSVLIRTAKDAYNYLKDMRELPKEHLRGLYLNSQYRLVHDEVISIGTLTSNVVHPREVFRPALEYSAAAIIVAHNHPSGSTKPSDADIEITKQLVQAGKILGIDLLDHIVVTKNSFASVPVEYGI